MLAFSIPWLKQVLSILFSYSITAFVEIIALMRVSCNSTSVKVFVHSHCQECVEFLLQFLKSWLEFNLALNAVCTYDFIF